MTRKAFILIAAPLAAIAFVIGSSAQKTYKPYAQWDKKDVEKMLSDSPWAQTQVNTNTGQMTNQANNPSVVTEVGTMREAATWNYHVMFLSARPIREAISRRVEIAQGAPNPAVAAKMKSFVERDFADYIVVAVTYDSKDPRFFGLVKQVFDSTSLGTIKNDTYLDRNDGKRMFLRQYIQPGDDGLGAKFVFDRMLDGKPFLDSSFSQVRFYSELSRFTVDRRFKIGDMSYNGKLEY